MCSLKPIIFSVTGAKDERQWRVLIVTYNKLALKIWGPAPPGNRISPPDATCIRSIIPRQLIRCGSSKRGLRFPRALRLISRHNQRGLSLLAGINQNFNTAVSLTADRIVATIRVLVRSDRSGFSVAFDGGGGWYDVPLHQPALDRFGTRFTQLLIVGQRPDGVSVAIDFNRMRSGASDYGTQFLQGFGCIAPKVGPVESKQSVGTNRNPILARKVLLLDCLDTLRDLNGCLALAKDL